MCGMQPGVSSQGKKPPRSGRPVIRHPFSHRSLRGLSLFDGILGLAVFGLLMVFIAGLATDWAETRRQHAMARTLATIAAAAAAYAHDDFIDLRDQAESTSDITERTIAELISAGVLSSGTPATDANGDSYRIFYHAVGDTGLEVLVTTESGEDGTWEQLAALTGSPDVMLGMVEDATLTGYNMAVDVSDYQTAASLPVADKIAAFVHLNSASVIGSALYRMEIDGYTGLQQMETDLDLQGYDLTGVAALSAETVSIQATLDVSGDATLLGALDVSQSLTVTGTAEIEDGVQASEATVTGTLTATEVTVSDTAEITTLSVEEALSADTLYISDTLSASSVYSTDLTANTATLSEASATEAVVEEVIAERVRADTSLTTDTAVINTLSVGSCSGC